MGDKLQSPVGKLTEEESHSPRSTKGALEWHKGAEGVGLGGSAGLLGALLKQGMGDLGRGAQWYWLGAHGVLRLL